jgi:hypothetical protein
MKRHAGGRDASREDPLNWRPDVLTIVILIVLIVLFVMFVLPRLRGGRGRGL